MFGVVESAAENAKVVQLAGGNKVWLACQELAVDGEWTCQGSDQSYTVGLGAGQGGNGAVDESGYWSKYILRLGANWAGRVGCWKLAMDGEKPCHC